MSFKSDKAWSDRYTKKVQALLLMKLSMYVIKFLPATEEQDTKFATDFVAQVETGTVAVRIRNDGRDFRDLTLRSRRRNGVRTELAKIRDDGFARWYLYCWVTCRDGPIGDYVFIDLDKLRASGLLSRSYEEQTADDGETYFISIRLPVLDAAGVITVNECHSDSPLPIHGWRKPRRGEDRTTK